MVVDNLNKFLASIEKQFTKDRKEYSYIMSINKRKWEKLKRKCKRKYSLVLKEEE